MPRKAGLTALLLVGVGVVLGATVFRSDVAQATGLAQSVTVDNTAANPVPVTDDHTNITFHAQTDAGSGDGTDCRNDHIYTVPAGKQFVAQFVSINHATGSQLTTVDQALLANTSQVG